jgi:hypothetical protein
VAFWIALVLFVASRPRQLYFPGNATSLHGMPRWVVQYPYHVGAFLILAMLAVGCLSAARVARGRRGEAVALAIAFSISIVSETMQSWVPSRTPAIRDLVLDMSGAVAGLGLLRACRRSRTATTPSLPSEDTGPRAGSL